MGWELYEVLSPVLLALLGWLGKLLANYLKTKTKNELLRGMAERTDDFVYTAVQSVDQTLKKEIRKAKSPRSKGGVKITKEEAKMLKQAAMEQIKSYWGVKGMSELGKVLGLDNTSLGSYLESKVEATIAEGKKLNPLA